MSDRHISRALISLSALTLAGGSLSLIASAGQSPPSAAGSKKATVVAPSASPGRQATLPGLGKSAEPRRNPTSAPPPRDENRSADPVKQGHVDMEDPDANLKTGIYKGRNVVYTEGDTTVKGANAVYNKKTEELDVQGNLELNDPKHHVSGDKSHVDRKKLLAIITGNVVITLKPTPPDPSIAVDSTAAKQRQYPVIITCDRVDDFYKKDFILLNGHLVFKQTITKDDGKTVERTMTAEHAEYDGKTSKLHLFQPVKASDSEGQTIDFEKDAYVGTKEGEETLTSTGKSRIHFNLDDAKDPAEKADDKTGKDPVTPPVPKKF